MPYPLLFSSTDTERLHIFKLKLKYTCLDTTLLNLTANRRKQKNQNYLSVEPGVFLLKQINIRETYLKFWLLTEVFHLYC